MRLFQVRRVGRPFPIFKVSRMFYGIIRHTIGIQVHFACLLIQDRKFSSFRCLILRVRVPSTFMNRSSIPRSVIRTTQLFIPNDFIRASIMRLYPISTTVTNPNCHLRISPRMLTVIRVNRNFNLTTFPNFINGIARFLIRQRITKTRRRITIHRIFNPCTLRQLRMDIIGLRRLSILQVVHCSNCKQ